MPRNLAGTLSTNRVRLHLTPDRELTALRGAEEPGKRSHFEVARSHLRDLRLFFRPSQNPVWLIQSFGLTTFCEMVGQLGGSWNHTRGWLAAAATLRDELAHLLIP